MTEHSASPAPGHCPTRAHIECALQDDARLFAGVRAIVVHSAQQAGLGDKNKEELANAAIEVCQGAFAASRNGARSDVALKLSVSDSPDRLEISVECPGDILKGMNGSPIAGACASKNGSGLSGIDQVRYEAAGGLSRLTLIRRCSNPQ